MKKASICILVLFLFLNTPFVSSVEVKEYSVKELNEEQINYFVKKEFVNNLSIAMIASGFAITDYEQRNDLITYIFAAGGLINLYRALNARNIFLKKDSVVVFGKSHKSKFGKLIGWGGIAFSLVSYHLSITNTDYAPQNASFYDLGLALVIAGSCMYLVPNDTFVKVKPGLFPELTNNISIYPVMYSANKSYFAGFNVLTRF